MKFSNDAIWPSYSKKKRKKNITHKTFVIARLAFLWTIAKSDLLIIAKKKKKKKKIASAMEVFKEELIATPPTKIKW